MEYGLWRKTIIVEKLNTGRVLILVVMEYGLWHRSRGQGPQNRQMS